MDFNREYVKALRKNINKKRIIEKRLEKLRYDRDLLSENLMELERVKYDEEDDVIRLEKKSITNMLLALFGLYEDNLAFEKKQAYAAALSYDTCFAELEAVKADISALEAERVPLVEYETKYDRLVREKDKLIRSAKDSEAYLGLVELEEKIADAEQKIENIEEAIKEGSYAREIMSDLLEYLEAAEGYGLLSLMGSASSRNGIQRMATSKANVYAQHRELDNVHEIMKLLCVQLRKFSNMITEEIECEGQPEVGKLLRGANYLYNGMAINIYIESKIKEGMKSARQVDIDIMVAINALIREKEKTEELIPRLERAKKQYILGAEI